MPTSRRNPASGARAAASLRVSLLLLHEVVPRLGIAHQLGTARVGLVAHAHLATIRIGVSQRIEVLRARAILVRMRAGGVRICLVRRLA